jgi:hypothetical protein
LTVLDSKNIFPKKYPTRYYFLLGIFLFVSFLACSSKSSSDNSEISAPAKIIDSVLLADSIASVELENAILNSDTFSRSNIITQLQTKKTNKSPFIIRVFVPLCDNVNQGIVPVGASLGNGKNLKTNLYWGALYGVKTHFLKQGWKSTFDTIAVNDTILERIVFEKIIDEQKVVIIADAYAGDQMAACLNQFFIALADKETDSVTTSNGETYSFYQPDLVAFTGHNGLMDVAVPYQYNQNAKQKDVIILACISHNYFAERLKILKAYPLITTKSLMAPEAYVLNDAIIAWASMKSEDEIYSKALQAYSTYQKCSIKAASTVFNIGWDK